MGKKNGTEITYPCNEMVRYNASRATSRPTYITAATKQGVQSVRHVGRKARYIFLRVHSPVAVPGGRAHP